MSTSKKATGGSPNNQTPFDRHIPICAVYLRNLFECQQILQLREPKSTESAAVLVFVASLWVLLVAQHTPRGFRPRPFQSHRDFSCPQDWSARDGCFSKPLPRTSSRVVGLSNGIEWTLYTRVSSRRPNPEQHYMRP